MISLEAIKNKYLFTESNKEKKQIDILILKQKYNIMHV